jgi:hypothetical protein
MDVSRHIYHGAKVKKVSCGLLAEQQKSSKRDCTTTDVRITDQIYFSRELPFNRAR